MIFWKYISHSDIADIIPKLALRLLGTVTNSVPSERAFSTLRLQHSKLRSRLRPDRLNKLVFIYINSRVLQRSYTDIHRLSEEELLQLEEELDTLESPEEQGVQQQGAQQQQGAE